MPYPPLMIFGNSNMFPKSLCTEANSLVEVEAALFHTYRRVLCLHRQLVDIAVGFLLLDWALDSRFAAIFIWNWEGNRNASNNSMHNGFACLTCCIWKIHKYIKSTASIYLGKTYSLAELHSDEVVIWFLDRLFPVEAIANKESLVEEENV